MNHYSTLPRLCLSRIHAVFGQVKLLLYLRGIAALSSVMTVWIAGDLLPHAYFLHDKERLEPARAAWRRSVCRTLLRNTASYFGMVLPGFLPTH